jgi:ferritin-like protein
MTSAQAPVAIPDAGAPPEDESGALTRAGLFQLIGASAAGAAGLTLLSSPAAFASETRAAPNRATDVKILQYALTLEYLGATFYDSALKHARLSGDAHEVALAFRGHERAHVKFVRATLTKLGAKPHPAQRFDFGAATRSRLAFLKTSATIEEMCVETLNGAGPLVSKPVLIGASELVSVEARQASWVRGILGIDPAPFAFSPYLTAAQSMAAVKKLGFVKGGLS